MNRQRLIALASKEGAGWFLKETEMEGQSISVRLAGQERVRSGLALVGESRAGKTKT